MARQQRWLVAELRYSGKARALERRIDRQLGQMLEAQVLSALFVAALMFSAFVFLPWPSAVVASVAVAALAKATELNRALLHNFGLNRDEAVWEHALFAVSALRSPGTSIDQVLEDLEARLDATRADLPRDSLSSRTVAVLSGFAAWFFWTAILIVGMAYAAKSARPSVMPVAERLWGPLAPRPVLASVPVLEVRFCTRGGFLNTPCPREVEPGPPAGGGRAEVCPPRP